MKQAPSSNPTFWRDRPTFVTGVTLLVGSRLARRLVDLGAAVVCLVRDWGLRSERRSEGRFVRVKDRAAAYTLVTERLAEIPALGAHAFNLSNEKPVTVLERVDLTLRPMDSKLEPAIENHANMDSKLEPAIENQASSETQKQYLDATRTRQQLLWRPSFTIDEGLSRTIRWYRDFLETSGAAS